MSENYIDCIQQTAEWFSARCGKITASNVPLLLERLKTGAKKGERSQKSRDYIADVVCERLTNDASEHYVSYYMERGSEYESFARAAYEVATGTLVEPAGFFIHPTIPMTGASPDGLVGDAGLLEIKCPQSSVHLAYLLGGEIPENYEPQIMWQLACSGRAWCDFVSYHPRMPKHLQLFIRRTERNEERIKVLAGEVLAALAEIDATVAELAQDDSGESKLSRQLKEANHAS